VVGWPVSAEDVALYGALCSLAELDRSELKRRVLDGPLRPLLDLVPEVRDIVVDVYESRYGRALGAAKGLTLGAWALDLHLAPHAELLRKHVYDRCVLQYFLPYKSVSLVKVAAAFDSDVAEVEAAAATLVMAGKLSARIDSGAKTLTATSAEARSEALAAVSALAADFPAEARTLLLRMSCIEHDLVIRGRPLGPLGGGGGGPAGGLAQGSMLAAYGQDPQGYGANGQDSNMDEM